MERCGTSEMKHSQRNDNEYLSCIVCNIDKDLWYRCMKLQTYEKLGFLENLNILVHHYPARAHQNLLRGLDGRELGT